MKIAIIDYGMGNIHSVAKALSLYGAKPLITNKKKEISACEKLILPGVGAFDDAMMELEKQNLAGLIKDEIKKKKPFLGICLGMQLLMEESQEAKIKKGLGIFKGKVIRFLEKASGKVPHMGWNDIKAVVSDCPLLKGINPKFQVYFCHSYYVLPDDWSCVAATCEYGVEFAAALWKENVYAVQFHPEKSQQAGLTMIKNFVQLC